MLSACTLSQGVLVSYRSAGFGTFLQISALVVPIGWSTVQIVRQRRKKLANTALTTPCAKQAASQSTFINEKLFSTCD
jgi:hypothetical protein